MATSKTPQRRRQRVKYDVSDVRPRDPVPLHQWRDGAGADVEAAPDSFAARVEARRVDLVALVKEGIPPRSYHAHSEGMLVRGKRHHIAAPHKSGKSLVCLVHSTRLALDGEVVVILDRENGADLYAERLAAIMDAWELNETKRADIRKRLNYYEFPMLRRGDADDLVHYLAEEQAADLVVLDSQRMFLSDYGLAEGGSDDYARFMAYAIDPLHRARVSTLILDNTGHDGKRARGSSSKLDLNEQLFSLKEVQPFDRQTRGIVELSLERSRFGDRGSWRMAIGGGVFGEWQSDDARVLAMNAKKPELKPAVYEVLRDAGGPVGQHKLLEAVRGKGVKVRTADARKLLRQWVRDREESLQHVEAGYVADQ